MSNNKPTNLFNAKTFDEQLVELKNIPFEVKPIRGNPSLEQTKRNKVRRELIEGLYASVKAWLEDGNFVNGVFYTNEGIAIEVENKDVVNSGANESGMMTLVLDLSIQNLSYDSMENLYPSPINEGAI